VGIWAVEQVVFESGPPSFVRSGLMRAYGSFGEPNPFAALAWAIMLPLLACCVIAGESRIARIAAGIGAIVGLVVLGLTQSRGGFLGAAAGIAVIGGAVVLKQSVRLRQTAGIALALGTAAVISTAVVAAPWDDTGDQTTSANWADQERTAHWLAATQMIEEHPIFGVGAGDFSDEYRSATTNWRFRVSRGHAHNAYLQVAAEAGIPAVLAYIWLLAGISPSLIRRATPDRRHWLPIGVLGVTAALATHQVVDYLHVLSLGILFAGLWAAALAVGQEGLSPREHNFVA
jgi:O-antigen ligase